MRKFISLLMLVALFACSKEEIAQVPEVIKTDGEFKLYGIKYADKPQTRGVALKDNLWENGQTIKINFLNGTETQKAKVKEFAAEWLEYANLKFEYVTEGQSDVRIAFDYPGEDFTWSFVGTDSKYVSQNLPTTHFRKIGNSDKLIKREVLMQFGHILGLVNEHQGPNNPIEWDFETTYEVLMDEGWSISQIKDVLRQYSSSASNYTEFDAKSIMVWPVEDVMTLNDKSYTRNSVLSNMDKEFIAKLYPKAKYKLVDTGIPSGSEAVFANNKIYYMGTCGGVFYIDSLANKMYDINNQIPNYNAYYYSQLVEVAGFVYFQVSLQSDGYPSLNNKTFCITKDEKVVETNLSNRAIINCAQIYQNKIFVGTYDGLYYAELSAPTKFFKYVINPIPPKSEYWTSENYFNCNIRSLTIDKYGRMYFTQLDRYIDNNNGNINLNNFERAICCIENNKVNILYQHDVSNKDEIITAKEGVTYGYFFYENDFRLLTIDGLNINKYAEIGRCSFIASKELPGIYVFCDNDINYMENNSIEKIYSVPECRDTPSQINATSKGLFLSFYRYNRYDLFHIDNNNEVNILQENYLYSEAVEAYNKIPALC